jgi:hypothetical protein
MSRRYSFLVLLFLVLLTAVVTAQTDFTVVLLPDTQYYSETYPNIFNSQANWIAANASALKIQLVLGLGDIVNTSANTYEWQNADAAVRVIENAGIPTLMAIGNHDYTGTLSKRSATAFNQYFGPTRYSGKSWYKGNYPSGSNENFYGVVQLGGQTYLILVLEFVPRTAALNWAKSILDANTDKSVIVVEHSFMYSDGTRVDLCDTGDMNSDNNGEAQWMKLLRNYGNIITIVNGHLTTGGGHGRRADLGVKGNIVSQMLSDYQAYPNGGDGWLRILKFDPSTQQISVTTYSPYLNSYMTGSSDQFTVSYGTPVPVSGKGTIAGRVRINRIGSTQDCQAVSGATMTANGTSVTTSSTGAYSFSLNASTSYSVAASKSGWVSQSQTVNAWVGYPADLEFFLTPQRGYITGYVKNASGVAVSGVSVNFMGGAVSFNRTVKTNSSGYYTSGLISIGGYTVTATLSGHTTQSKTATVTNNATTSLSFSSF